MTSISSSAQLTRKQPDIMLEKPSRIFLWGYQYSTAIAAIRRQTYIHAVKNYVH
jgi:hypothetical protein